MPEDDEPQRIEAGNQQGAGNVSLAVVVRRAEPPAQLPAHRGQDQAQQDDADGVVDEQEGPIGQAEYADEDRLL